LRPRLVLTFSFVAIATTVGLATASYLLVRRTVLHRATDAAVSEARFDLRIAADAMSTPATPAQLVQVNAALERNSGVAIVTVAGDQVLQTSVSISDIAVPASLTGLVQRGRIGWVWQRVAGRPYAVVGGKVGQTGPTYYFFFSLAGAEADLASLRTVLVAVSVALVVLAGVIGALAARGLLLPIRRAAFAARTLEGGRLEIFLPEDGHDELAELARAFNRMAVTLDRTVGDLRQQQRHQNQFVSDVAHELRNPLTALTTAATVLEDNRGGLNEPGRRSADLLIRESGHLATLVEDLIEISRMDAARATMSREPVELRRLVADVLDRRGWDGQVETDLPAGIVVTVDRRRLDTVVANLVSNALEHGRPPVAVRAAEEDNHVIIEVSDAGSGIEPQHLPRIFDRFYKADSSRPRGRGSGLGLAIARENTRLHGGDISVESAPGNTLFRVTLPQAEPS
jgi:two-component system sensor histidine kinase MtrB